MKRCPSCDRTYADETMSFCLADGSLLSAPYDPLKKDAPPTAIMPAAARDVVPPTQPANKAIPTITSFPIRHNFDETKNAGERPKRRINTLMWIAGAFITAAIVVGVILGLRQSLGGGSLTSNSPENLRPANNLTSPTPSGNTSPGSLAIPTAPLNRSSPIERERPTSRPESRSISSPEARRENNAPVASPTIDYNRPFPGNEVDQKVRVLFKPNPTYTEVARGNRGNGNCGVARNILIERTSHEHSRCIWSARCLTERAIDAAKQIKFVPAMKDGHPVSMWMELRYNFNLY